MFVSLKEYCSPGGQRGISLFVSMILLAAITILGLVSARLTFLELAMSGNEQNRVTAFEGATAAIDRMWMMRLSILNVDADLGTSWTVSLPEADGFDSDKTTAWVTRTGTKKVDDLPALADISSSIEQSNKLPAAYFELHSRYDDRTSTGAHVSITQGALVILPPQNQETGP